MKTAALVALLGLLALSEARQGRAEGLGWARRGDDDCDLKKIEDASWCSKCKATLDSDGVDKEGKCTTCKTKTEKVKICVKVYYKANCWGKTEEEQGTCWGKAFEEVKVKARVVFRCKECKAEGKEGEKCSKKGCKGEGKELAKACASSGTWPHGGTKP